MLGKIVVGDSLPDTIKQLDPSKENVVAQVSTKVSGRVVQGHVFFRGSVRRFMRSFSLGKVT